MSALAAFAVAVLLFAVCGWYLSRSKHALEEWPLTEGRVRTQVKSYPAGKTAKPSKPPPAPGIPGYWFPATALISDERNRQIRKTLVAERGEVCQSCGCGGHVDMHERLHRGRGGDPTDPANILLPCRLCHSLCHQFPAEAERRGLIERRWTRA